MAGWLAFFKERFPLPVYLILTMGIVLSGGLTGSGVFSPRAFLTASAGILLFFLELRLMDDLKDYHKDVIVNPARPLPRGILSLNQAKRGVNLFFLLMTGYSAILFFLFNPVCAACYLFVSFYLWLIYKEFYVASWLTGKPLFYASIHQVILIPLAAFSLTISRPQLLWSKSTGCLGLIFFGGFFAYDICRNLDPNAHPVLKTYLQRYGPKKTLLMLAVVLGLAALAASGCGLGLVLWPGQVMLLAGFCLIFPWPARFKIVKMIASISLIVHLWCAAIDYFIG